MNSKSRKIIIITLVLAFTLILINNFIVFKSLKDEFASHDDNLKSSKISERIHINNNWTDAKISGICTGFGTHSEPYVIEDLVIDGDDSGTCILIENSWAYFRIENCTLFNSGSGSYKSGIKLISVSNGLIFDNMVNNNDHGIYLNSCNNNTILGNTANNNYWDGVFLETGYNNTIKGNIVSGHYGSGIGSWYSYNNIIKDNIVDDNGLGISLEYSNNNKITGNTAKVSSSNGLHILGGDYNVIFENDVKENYYGIVLEDTAMDNLIYLNNLTDNVLHAIDNGISNQWDDGSIGNYWDDYSGADADDNGIGDTPYSITGTASSEDRFPIWDDGPNPQLIAIPGYHLFIVLGILAVVVILASRKR